MKTVRIAITFLCAVSNTTITYALPPENGSINIEQMREQVQRLYTQSRTVTNVIRGGADLCTIGEGICSTVDYLRSHKDDEGSRIAFIGHSIFDTAIVTACESFGQTAGHEITAFLLTPSLCHDVLPSWQKAIFFCSPIAIGMCARKAGRTVGICVISLRHLYRMIGKLSGH